MSSNQKFVNFVIKQIDNTGRMVIKKRFCEYAIYPNGKLFGLVCNNKLFIPQFGRKFIIEFPIYSGAKPSFLIDNKIEDRECLSELVRISVKELSKPKKKNKKQRLIVKSASLKTTNYQNIKN